MRTHTHEFLFAIGAAVIGAVVGLALLLGGLWLMVSYAAARDNGQWGDQPANIRQWFQSLMQADAFEADDFDREGDHYVAVITDGKGIIPNGTRIHVPNGKMKWDQGNPTGHGIIFIGSGGAIYCYVAPGGV